jgi:hypothetical protein
MVKFNNKLWTVTATAKTVTFRAQDGEVLRLTKPAALALVAKLRQLAA